MTPAVVAHRGLAARYPENTLESIGAALDAGLGFVEFDVQLSADRVPVLCHDRDLQRTAGVPGAVAQLSWEHLRAIRVGETARFGLRFANVCLPSLAQVVTLLAGRADAHAFVEIKRASIESVGRLAVLDAVLPVLAPVMDRSTLISFDADILSLARRRGVPGIGWVIEAWDDLTRFRAEAIGPQWLFCNHLKIPPGQPLWPGAWRWAIYEVVDAALAWSLHARGADAVESMDADRLAAALAAGPADPPSPPT